MQWKHCRAGDRDGDVDDQELPAVGQVHPDDIALSDAELL
jgi:hypothetical protein